jgi:acetyltransferase
MRIPGEGGELDPDSRLQAETIIATARSQNRVLLNEFESKKILSYYGIPTVETRIACTEDEAVSCANALGCPVVLKIFSQTITHKTDVGGVKLYLEDESSVRSAFREIRTSVEKTVGPDHFSGVIVQPMVRLEGLR